MYRDREQMSMEWTEEIPPANFFQNLLTEQTGYLGPFRKQLAAQNISRKPATNYRSAKGSPDYCNPYYR